MLYLYPLDGGLAVEQEGVDQHLSLHFNEEELPLVFCRTLSVAEGADDIGLEVEERIHPQVQVFHLRSRV